MERGWRQKFDDIHTKIMDGYRRGVCNKNGDSIKVNGVYVGKPRYIQRRGAVDADTRDTFLERYRKGIISFYT